MQILFPASERKAEPIFSRLSVTNWECLYWYILSLILVQYMLTIDKIDIFK